MNGPIVPCYKGVPDVSPAPSRVQPSLPARGHAGARREPEAKDRARGHGETRRGPGGRDRRAPVSFRRSRPLGPRHPVARPRRARL